MPHLLPDCRTAGTANKVLTFRSYYMLERNAALVAAARLKLAAWPSVVTIERHEVTDRKSVV